MSHVDRNGDEITYEYDADEHLTRKTLSGGNVTQYSYDAFDHRTGAVASTIWVRDPGTHSPIVFISIDGHPIQGR